MKRILQVVLVGMCMMGSAGSALALTGTGGGGGGDDPPADPPPPPPPTTTSFSHVAQDSGSIGNSTLGASYQASLTVAADSTRTSLSARGYAWAGATLLGMTKNLVIINGMATAGSSFGTEISTYLLGQQVFDYKDSFSTSFSKTFTAIDWRNNLWSYTNSWTFLGTGVTIRLALDGGTTLSGSVNASPTYLSATINPRAWVDAGGTLSFSLLWISGGSLSGTVHVVDAQGTGTVSIDTSRFWSGGPINWFVYGSGKLCSGGGSITGCIVGRCGTLVSWANYCPGWLALSGSASGSF